MKCLSRHCNGHVKEDSNYCGSCGLDLRMDREEIKARDAMLEVFNEFLTKHGEKPIDMLDLDAIFKTHGARISMLFMKRSLEAIDKIAKERQGFQFMPKGLYGLFWKRLLELDDRSGDVIPLQSVYTKLCRSFSIKKRECQELLFMLRDFGLVEFKKRGLKILYRS